MFPFALCVAFLSVVVGGASDSAEKKPQNAVGISPVVFEISSVLCQRRSGASTALPQYPAELLGT